MKADDRRAALLIDADNLSPEGMAAALRHLRDDDLDVCVLRAYGSHETLAVIKEFLQHNAVRPVVNQGKGTTDAALVVDAMDLLHGGGLPPLVAIGSGDADFAPLVLRLREAGRHLVCFAQRQKAADGLDRFYAEVVHVDSPSRGAAAPASSRGGVKKAAEPRNAPSPSSARSAQGASSSARSAQAAPPSAARPAQAPAKSSAKAAPSKQPASKGAASAPPLRHDEDSFADQVWDVLEAFPGFREGRDIELNSVVQKLRELKLMGRSTSARNFFREHVPEVELSPEKQPNKLRWPED